MGAPRRALARARDARRARARPRGADAAQHEAVAAERVEFHVLGSVETGVRAPSGIRVRRARDGAVARGRRRRERSLGRFGERSGLARDRGVGASRRAPAPVAGVARRGQAHSVPRRACGVRRAARRRDVRPAVLVGRRARTVALLARAHHPTSDRGRARDGRSARGGRALPPSRARRGRQRARAATAPLHADATGGTATASAAAGDGPSLGDAEKSLWRLVWSVLELCASFPKGRSPALAAALHVVAKHCSDHRTLKHCWGGAHAMLLHFAEARAADETAAARATNDEQQLQMNEQLQRQRAIEDAERDGARRSHAAHERARR